VAPRSGQWTGDRAGKRQAVRQRNNPHPAFGTLLPSLGEGLGMRADSSLRTAVVATAP